MRVEVFRVKNGEKPAKRVFTPFTTEWEAQDDDDNRKDCASQPELARLSRGNETAGRGNETATPAR